MPDDSTTELAKQAGSYGGWAVGVVAVVQALMRRVARREEKEEAEAQARLEKAERELASQRERERQEMQATLVSVEASLKNLSAAVAALANLPTQLDHVEERMNKALENHRQRLDTIEGKVSGMAGEVKATKEFAMEAIRLSGGRKGRG